MTNGNDMQVNPVARALEEAGRKLLNPDTAGGGPRWPDERTQLNYTGASNDVLMRRSIDFVLLLHGQLPTLGTGHWRGLDYGVGWGRLASLMTIFGEAAQLDCADAWEKSINLARDCGLKNKMIHTPPVLESMSLANGSYDFVYSYSIMTHLPDAHIVNNVARLMDSLKTGGKLVFTLREKRFLDFLKRSGKLNVVVDRLADDGYWFGNAQSDDYGDTVVTDEWAHANLGSLGVLRSLGTVGSEPFQVVWTLTKNA